MQDVEAVFPTQVVGDVGEGGAGRLRDSVVDDDHVVFVCQRGQFTARVLAVTLLHFSQLVSGDGAFCKNRKDEVYKGWILPRVELAQSNLAVQCRAEDSDHTSLVFFFFFKCGKTDSFSEL